MKVTFEDLADSFLDGLEIEDPGSYSDVTIAAVMLCDLAQSMRAVHRTLLSVQQTLLAIEKESRRRRHLPQQLAGKPIMDLNLSVRARKAMNRKGISTVGDLLQRSECDLLEVKNFGEVTLQEIREKLAALGLKLQRV